MPIFKKLNIGDIVATSGTWVFRKLTTEEPLPIWNGTALDGTTWIIRSGWTAEAGYGVFDVGGIRTLDPLSHQRVNSLHIGYRAETVSSTPHAVDNGLTWDTSYSETEPRYAGTSDNTKEYEFSFSRGTDTTNPRLISWLLQNADLVSHRLQAGLYDVDNNLVASWDTLVNTYGVNIEVDPTSSDSISLKSVLTNNSELSAGTKLVIGDDVTAIGKYALSGCTSLTSVTIPKGVTDIGKYAFQSCTGLAEICVNEENKNYCSDSNGALFNKDKTTLIRVPAQLEGTFVIPEGVTTIDSDAFGKCDKLTNVSIPESVTIIHNGVFYFCTSLTNITIPEGVTDIQPSTFSGCTQLTYVVIPKSVKYIWLEAFYVCTSLKNVYYRGSKSEWSRLYFGSGNDALTNATIHYNYTD